MIRQMMSLQDHREASLRLSSKNYCGRPCSVCLYFFQFEGVGKDCFSSKVGMDTVERWEERW